jgi:kynurenine formamidase
MAAMMVRLSYTLSERTPFYEGLAKPSLERLYDLAKGDECNSFYFRSSNHCGTHVDGPWHFNPAGRKISDYDVNELGFTRPAIFDLDVGPGHLIGPGEFGDLRRIPGGCDILLLRTGFGRFRSVSPAYVDNAPGFSRAAAEEIINALPELRALALDFISVASLKHMAEGAEAHRVFLGCAGYSDRSVLLIEDAMLDRSLTTPDRVIVAPWMFEGLDSAPCTVIAEFDSREVA